MPRPQLDPGTLGAIRTVKRQVTGKNGKTSERWRALAQYRKHTGETVQVECTAAT